MLNSDPYEIYLITKMKMESFHMAADRMRLTSILSKRKSGRHNKVLVFILHRAGKALIDTGNRLLKIA